MFLFAVLFFLQPDQPPVFLPTNLSAQNGSGVVESSELADLLMNLNIEPMSHVLDEATGIEHMQMMQVDES